MHKTLTNDLVLFYQAAPSTMLYLKTARCSWEAGETIQTRLKHTNPVNIYCNISNNGHHIQLVLRSLKPRPQEQAEDHKHHSSAITLSLTKC